MQKRKFGLVIRNEDIELKRVATFAFIYDLFVNGPCVFSHFRSPWQQKERSQTSYKSFPPRPHAMVPTNISSLYYQVHTLTHLIFIRRTVSGFWSLPASFSPSVWVRLTTSFLSKDKRLSDVQLATWMQDYVSQICFRFHSSDIGNDAINHITFKSVN